jgi:hypothetical protein
MPNTFLSLMPAIIIPAILGGNLSERYRLSPALRAADVLGGNEGEEILRRAEN